MVINRILIIKFGFNWNSFRKDFNHCSTKSIAKLSSTWNLSTNKFYKSIENCGKSKFVFVNRVSVLNDSINFFWFE